MQNINSQLDALKMSKLSDELKSILAIELSAAFSQVAAGEEKDMTVIATALQTEFKSLKGLLDQQADEIRTHGETYQKTADSIKGVETSIVNLNAELKGISDKYKEMETKMNRPNFGAGGEEYKTFGQIFTEHEAYDTMIKSGAFNSNGVNVKSFHTKATLTSAPASAGELIMPQRMGGIIAPPNRDLKIRDLMNVQNIGTNAIEYIRETLFTNASAPVAESNLKPESAMTFDVQNATVKTIAHWIPATRQVIADAGQLRNYIDNRLVYGLALTEENQILYGSGAGENLTGLMVDAGVQVAPAPVAGTTFIDVIRRSITMATLAGYPVTGICLHPSDWETIELTKGGDDHYIWANVNQNGVNRLWGVPVVQSLGMAAGDYLVGAFGLGSQIWDREQANVRVSDHHADFFTRNMIAILAEERLAMTTYRPQAFVRGTFPAVV